MDSTLIVSAWSSVTEYRAIVGNKVVFENKGSDPIVLFKDIYNEFSIRYPKFFKMDNLCKLGFLTTELLLKGINLSDRYQNDEIGIILMNSASSIDSDRRHQATLVNRENYFPSPSVFVYTLPNIVIGEISIRQKISGEGSFFISESFNADFLVRYIKELFKSGVVKCSIAGWIEFEEDNFRSFLFLVEKADRSETGFINFETDKVWNLYKRLS